MPRGRRAAVCSSVGWAIRPWNPWTSNPDTVRYVAALSAAPSESSPGGASSTASESSYCLERKKQAALSGGGMPDHVPQ